MTFWPQNLIILSLSLVHHIWQNEDVVFTNLGHAHRLTHTHGQPKNIIPPALLWRLWKKEIKATCWCLNFCQNLDDHKRQKATCCPPSPVDQVTPATKCCITMFWLINYKAEDSRLATGVCWRQHCVVDTVQWQFLSMSSASDHCTKHSHSVKQLHSDLTRNNTRHFMKCNR